MITKEQLIECIREATVEVEVLVPSTCFYARAGDSTTTTISVVNPEALIEALKAGIGAP